MIDSKETLLSKHIVVIAGDYPAPKHIKLVFVQQLVHSMVDRGVNITVIAPQSIVHSIVHKKRLFHKINYDRSSKGREYVIYRPYIVTFGNSKLCSKLLNWWNGRKVSVLLERIKPDVIYAHFWSSALFVTSYARRNNIPLFVACGEGDNALEDMVNSLSPKDIQKLTSSVSGVISVSSENKRKCIEYHLVNKKNIGVFPNCVDTDLFKHQDKSICRSKLGLSQTDFIIAFVGGFIPRKGPDRLAQAITSINDPSVKVMFIGKPFAGYSFDFDCQGVVYKGPVEHEDLPLYLNAADIFVLPTQKEGCCNAIVEALSVGLPVISSNGAFNDDILDKENSIRVNPDDVLAIKEAILKMKNDYLVREQMSNISQKRHSLYSIDRRAGKIINFINDIMSNKCVE